MRKLWIWLPILLICLTACTQAAEPSAGTSGEQQALLFERTPTVEMVKGDEGGQAEAKVIANVGYPTPLPTYLVASDLATRTPTPVVVIPTETPDPNATSTPTANPTATTAATAVPSPTSTPTQTPTGAATAVPAVAAYPYAVQAGSPAYISNITDPSAGCSWQGIGGQVFDRNGQPALNLVIRAGGTWNGRTSSLMGMGLTGSQLLYGESGYEVVLGMTAVNSTGSLWIQLYDLAGVPLSEKVVVNTYADCTQNLAVVNFRENNPGYNLYLPLVIPTAGP